MNLEKLKGTIKQALDQTVELEAQLSGLEQGQAAMIRHSLWEAADQLGILYEPEAPRPQ